MMNINGSKSWYRVSVGTLSISQLGEADGDTGNTDLSQARASQELCVCLCVYQLASRSLSFGQVCGLGTYLPW